MWECLAAVTDKVFKTFLDAKSEMVRNTHLENVLDVLLMVLYLSHFARYIMDDSQPMNLLFLYVFLA